MNDQSDFWKRPVTDTVTVELVPGDEPRLLIRNEGRRVAELDLPEARSLIEVLTVAVGELYILRRDPAALARVRTLLAEDVTLGPAGDGPQFVPETPGTEGQVKGQQLVQRYREGERSFPGVDLCRADLHRAFLRGANLSGADLSGADLRRANLFQVNLEGANLSQANLEESGLYQANLCRADLSRANLCRAFLSRANMAGAKVSPGQLAQAKVLQGAIMPDGSKYG